MDPSQDQVQPNLPEAQTSAPQAPQNSQTQAEPEAYRRYWIFAVIFLFLPFGILFGIYILLSGGVFKKSAGSWVPISQSEKIALIVIGVALQGFALFSSLS